MAAKTPHGGHDNDFVDENREKLTCTICLKVVRDPHLTACCGQNFCASCLSHWFEKAKKPNCPHCRAEGSDFQHIPDKKAKREVDILQVRCSNKKQGCTWTGELTGLNKHLESGDGCGYVMVKCSNRCSRTFWKTEQFQRRDLSKHLKDDCDRRPAVCKYCDFRDEYKKVINHEDHVCPEKPLQCPNKCGVGHIKRKDLPTHGDACPLQPVSCPFKNGGCSVKILRKDLDEHITTYTQQHLLQTFQRSDTLNQTLKHEIAFLRQTELNKAVKVSLDCISTHLDPESGSKMFRMTDFSEYMENETTWHSPCVPFPREPLLQFRLLVNPCVTGPNKSSHACLTIEGQVSPGFQERDTVRLSYDVSISLLDQVSCSSKQPTDKQSTARKMGESEFCKIRFSSDDLKQSKDEYFRKESFVSFEYLEKYLFNDSIVFSIKFCAPIMTCNYRSFRRRIKQ